MDYMVEANYGYFIEITYNNENKKVILNYNANNYDFNDMNINERIDLVDYLYHDQYLIIDEISYMFYLDNKKIFLTKIDDNKFKIEINISKSDITLTFPRNLEIPNFKDIKIETELSFNYDYKPEIGTELIDRKIENHNFNLKDILDKLDNN